MLDSFETLLMFVAFRQPGMNVQNRACIGAYPFDSLLDSIRTRTRLFADQLIEEG
jgi:hypothetical protein